MTQQAEELAEHLTKKGFPAAHFHAGMKVEEKKEIQDDFMTSKIQTVRFTATLVITALMVVQVVATIAFGMGIDKPGMSAYRLIVRD
jgi:superfamily II DNA helicase RecQ